MYRKDEVKIVFYFAKWAFQGKWSLVAVICLWKWPTKRAHNADYAGQHLAAMESKSIRNQSDFETQVLCNSRMIDLVELDKAKPRH